MIREERREGKIWKEERMEKMGYRWNRWEGRREVGRKAGREAGRDG